MNVHLRVYLMMSLWMIAFLASATTLADGGPARIVHTFFFMATMVSMVMIVLAPSFIEEKKEA